ncbi:MAG TPA: hypothetical protein VJN48_03115 [Terriglobales bacterium]|nr:hypothetical protein [Terriglobales bacterium]
MHATVKTSRAAPDEAAWDLFVFRKARESLCSGPLKQQLLACLRSAMSCRDQDGLLNCLVRAGELECALADLGSPELARAARAVDALAAMTLQPEFREPALDILAAFSKLELPPTVSLSHPEGFSYYGLHPLDFWDLARQTRVKGPSAAVIGIRSIGTTLSSVVCHALHCLGQHAERITVRPEGPPYRRSLEFTAEQTCWVREHLGRGSEFIVVDEGPGFSGSSFAAVGRALRHGGVPNPRILFLGSRSPESTELRSRFDHEWSTFSFCSAVQGTRIPAAAKVYCAGGCWRKSRFARPQDWPACWTQLERNKYYSADGGSLFKFEGFGRYGQTVGERAWQLDEAGFGPAVLSHDSGFIEYATVPGQPLRRIDCNGACLKRLAEYCAFRAATQTAAAPSPVSLESMLAHNLRVEFGVEQYELRLPVDKLVIADSRMMPCEWLAAGEQFIKTDGASHGDDHLFPGATDIAWDLAGVIVEWNLELGQQEFFLREYQRRSGDNPASRLPAYLLAYSVSRMAFCRMGAAAMGAWDDAHRLGREYHRHRNRVASLLGLGESGARSALLLSALPAEQAA